MKIHGVLQRKCTMCFFMTFMIIYSYLVNKHNLDVVKLEGIGAIYEEIHVSIVGYSFFLWRMFKQY